MFRCQISQDYKTHIFTKFSFQTKFKFRLQIKHQYLFYYPRFLPSSFKQTVINPRRVHQATCCKSKYNLNCFQVTPKSFPTERFLRKHRNNHKVTKKGNTNFSHSAQEKVNK